MGKRTWFLGTIEDLKWLIRRTAEVCPGVFVLGASNRWGDVMDPLKDELKDCFTYYVTNLTKEHQKEHQKWFGAEEAIYSFYTVHLVASHERTPENPEKIEASIEDVG